MSALLRSTCALLAVSLLVLGTASHASADTITLQWDPAPELVGYRVHVGVQSGSYTQHYDVGQATLFAFSTAAPGQRYCFSVSAYLTSTMVEGPNSTEVCGYSNTPPTLINPGNRTSTVGQAVTLQLQGSDADGQPLTYSASGLPAGLSLMASTGFISGTGTTAGTYTVTANTTDGVLSATPQVFTWSMTAGADTTRPTASITAPTSAATFSTANSTINLGGAASDNVGVTQIQWWSDRGGSGVATGTTNWSVSNVALQTGTNVITIAAVDAAGNSGFASLAVTRTTTPTDTTLPAVSIMAPTTGTTYSTTSSAINLSGNSSDNVGVTQVRWTNDRGGSGVASGTTSWGVSNAALQTGTNVIAVTALDAAGNARTATLTVTRSTAPPPDTTIPTATIATPTTGTTFSSTTSTINLTGSASDNVGVTQVRWTNDRGGSGVASGTTSWAVASIPLMTGTNLITITAVDAAGNPGMDALTVTYAGTTTPPPPPPSPTLTLSVVRSGTRSVQLTWTGAIWRTVDIYRDGIRIKNTKNDGTIGDFVPRGGGTFKYQVCAPGSTATCSNMASITF